MAAILGRNFVLPDDVKRVAPAVLTHRLILRPESRLRKVTPAAVVEEILGEIPVPTAAAGRSASVAVMKWFLGAAVAAGRRPGVSPGPAGLCHVRAAGRDARQPLPGPHLGRNICRPRGSATGSSANVGETVAVVITIENHGALPVAWLLVEDLLPRHALIYEPPSLRVSGRRLQLAMFSRRGRKTMSLSIARAIAAATTRSARWCSRPATCSACTAAIAWPPSRTFLLVYPKVEPLEGYDLASRRPIGEVRMSTGCSRTRRASPACGATKPAIR